jgi:hypothetical protein
MESSVRPWKAPSKAITPGRPVCRRASLTAFSTALRAGVEERRTRLARDRSEGAEPLGQRDRRLVRDDGEVGVEEPGACSTTASTMRG